MTNVIDLEAIKKLSTAEKREIIEAIEQTIEEEVYSEGVPGDYEEEESEEELQLLQDRLHEYQANPGDVLSLEDLEEEFSKDRRG